MAIDTSKKLSEVILQVLREENLDINIMQQRAITLWSVLFGPTINKATRNVYMKERTLIVELQSSVVRQELSMMKNKIIAKFNSALGQEFIKEIVFR
jgi:hypothetical protein